MTSTYDAQTADTNASATTSPATPAPNSERITVWACEWLLGMPMGVATALMWLTGAALLGSCALAVYAVGSVLVGLVAGSP